MIELVPSMHKRRGWSAISYASCCGCRLGNTDNLLLAIQDKIKWADSMSDTDRKHKKEVEDKAEELRKSIKVSGVKLLIQFSTLPHSQSVTRL